MIDGHTRLVGLIGWPTRHSLSPLMHNAAFQSLMLNWSYVPLPVQLGRVENAISGLAALGFRGANVTIPYKEAIIPLLHSLYPEAKEIGAVITIVVETDGTLVGHNTDSLGFIAALQHSGFDPKGRSAVICGGGGAARAAVHGLLDAGARGITLLNRTLARAERLISAFVDERLHAETMSLETLVKAAEDGDLLVNATPVGMWPHVDGSIWPSDLPVSPHLTVFDLVYNPVETQLLQQAQESGARVISGLEMLLQQGAAAFELWTGKKAPIATMRTALQEEVR